MSVFTRVGSFAITTGAAASTQQITGVGFTPKALILMLNGMTDTSTGLTTTEPLRACFGLATSSSDQRCFAGSSNAGQTTSQAQSGHRTDNIIATLNPAGAGTWEGLIAIQSMDTDGFTLVVNQQFASAYQCFYWAIGGDELTAVSQTLARSGSASNPTTTTYTGFGLQGNAVLLIGGHAALTAATNGDIQPQNFLGIGLALDSGPRWHAWAVDNNAQTPPTGAAMFARAWCFGWHNGGPTQALNSTGQFLGFTNDGFTIRWNGGGPTVAPMLALVVKGGLHSADAFPVSKTTGNLVSVTNSTQPAGGLVINATGNASDSPATVIGIAPLELIAGFFDSAYNERGFCFKTALTGGTTSKMLNGIDFEDSVIRIESAPSIGLEAGLLSLDSSGFTFKTTLSGVGSDELHYFWTISSANPLPRFVGMDADYQWLGGDEY